MTILTIFLTMCGLLEVRVTRVPVRIFSALFGYTRSDVSDVPTLPSVLTSTVFLLPQDLSGTISANIGNWVL